jgi:hypothetical protein
VGSQAQFIVQFALVPASLPSLLDSPQTPAIYHALEDYRCHHACCRDGVVPCPVMLEFRSKRSLLGLAVPGPS